MKEGYLGRLIARAAPPAPKAASAPPVADPFEAVEEAPLTPPPPPAFAATPSARTGEEHGFPVAREALPPVIELPVTDAPLRREPPIVRFEESEEREVRPTLAPIVPSISPKLQAPELAEDLNDSSDREPAPTLVPIASAPVAQILEPAVRLEETEHVIERLEHVEIIERVIREPLAAPSSDAPPEPVRMQPTIPAPPALVQPPSGSAIEAPVTKEEPPSLVIGRLIVDVVATPQPARRPQRTRAASRVSSFRARSSAQPYFGLGQI
jgi:hypothetical protein